MFWARDVIHIRGVGYLQLETSPPKGCFCLEMVFCLVGTHALGLCLGLMVTVYGQLCVPCDKSVVCDLLTSMVSCPWYLWLLMSVVDVCNAPLYSIYGFGRLVDVCLVWVI